MYCYILSSALCVLQNIAIRIDFNVLKGKWLPKIPLTDDQEKRFSYFLFYFTSLGFELEFFIATWCCKHELKCCVLRAAY